MDYTEFERVWREPVTFDVEIVEARFCRAGHKKGQKFHFAWNTPEGMCSESFVGMYPVLFSLRLGGNMELLGDEERNARVYTCPSRVVKFRIKAAEQCPFCGNKENLQNCKILLGEKVRTFKICPECREKYGKFS